MTAVGKIEFESLNTVSVIHTILSVLDNQPKHQHTVGSYGKLQPTSDRSLDTAQLNADWLKLG